MRFIQVYISALPEGVTDRSRWWSLRNHRSMIPLSLRPGRGARMFVGKNFIAGMPVVLLSPPGQIECFNGSGGFTTVLASLQEGEQHLFL